MSHPPDESRARLSRRRPAAEGRVEDYEPAPKRSEFDEFPSDDDIERFSGVTFKCPECGTELYDDVELCWSCGHAVGARAHAGEGIPRWVLIVSILLVAGLVLLAVL